MSNEVKNKVDMDPKYIIKLTVTLFLTCMVVAGVLGWVNSITKDKIAAITWEKTVTAMKEVISADDFSDAMDLTDDMTAAATAQGGCRLSGAVRRTAHWLRHQCGVLRLSGYHLHDGGH